MEAHSLPEATKQNELRLVQQSARANFLCRALAYLTDLGVITLLHFSTNLLFVLSLELFSRHSAKSFVASQNFQVFSEISDLVCFVGYFTITVWYFNGFTLGKWLLKIRVESESGEISLQQALFRSFSYGLSYLTFSLGFILPLLRGDQCALHDLIARTNVTKIN